MTNSTQKLPFYAKLSYCLLSILLVGFFLNKGTEVVVPLVFSILLAIFLLRPMLFLEKRKWCPRPLAVLLPLMGALIILAGIVTFFSSQIALFTEDMPVLKERLNEQVALAQQWIRETLNVSLRDQNQYINETLKRMQDSGIVGKTFLSITSSLSLIVLIPVFTYLLLYYKDIIIKFFIDIVKDKDEGKVKDVFRETRLVMQSYLLGLGIELVVVIGLNTLGLSIIGVKYAILLAILAGVLNLIPYIGMISATAIAMMVTLISTDNTIDVVWVAVTLGMVQLVDNYFIMPLIVGSRVQINALVTILGVLVGGLMMGVPGMFLSIPCVAIMKVIFDRIEELKPWGELLGNGVDEKAKKDKTGWWNFFKKAHKKPKPTLHRAHHAELKN